MLTLAKHLFRPEALRPRLAAFHLPPAAAPLRARLKHWAALLAKAEAAFKETELLPAFLSDVFIGLLGYTEPASGGDRYTLKREAKAEADGFADAAVGVFSVTGGRPTVVAALEGKGPRDPLDRPYGGRKRSAVEQALLYAVNHQCDWYIVTNLREVRLYHKGRDQLTFERFEIAALADDEAALRRFVFLLGAERMVGPSGRCHLDALLTESHRAGEMVTRDYYRAYADLRADTFKRLREENPSLPPLGVLAATQKMLDRVLFIAFCEDRGLLPAGTIDKAHSHSDPYNPRPVWDNFKGLFRAVDLGDQRLGIERYNGGLYAPDAVLDALIVPDEVCHGFKRLAGYDYSIPSLDGETGRPGLRCVDVEILGHIFEQSITDLEEMGEALASGKADAAGPTKRKREGAFYTPELVTRFIVSQTLGPVLRDRFEALRRSEQSRAAPNLRRTLDAPAVYDPDDLTAAQRNLLTRFWNAWVTELLRLRVADIAAGSGAFLAEAFDQLFAEYGRAGGHLADLGGEGPALFDRDRQILQHNLYGVDINAEAVEVCRLGMWIKTARVGQVLTSLDRTIRAGNSVIADPAIDPKALDWGAAFPEVFEAGGFDVIVGNPPYVRQEWISRYKPHLARHFGAYDGAADLYVYFLERAL